jgi:hypothetical protein
MNAHIASGSGFISEPLTMPPPVLPRMAVGHSVVHSVVDDNRLRTLLRTLKTLPDSQPPENLVEQTLHRIEAASISSPLPPDIG